MYADKITKSMQATIDETEEEKFKKYNNDNNIVPKTISNLKNYGTNGCCPR